MCRAAPTPSQAEALVPRSGYYPWAAGAPSLRAIRHAWLTDVIGTIHQASRGTYGAPRVHVARSSGGLPQGHYAKPTTPPSTQRAGIPA